MFMYISYAKTNNTVLSSSGHYSCHSVPRLAAMKAYMSAVSSICRKTGTEEEEEMSRCTCLSHFGQKLFTYVIPN